MMLAMTQDIRVILIKLADRTHNMRTLTHLNADKQMEIAQETLDIYAPLANRLGISWIKYELEDNALKYLHPEIYYDLKRSVAATKADRERVTQEGVSVLQEALSSEGVQAQVMGRPKHFFSIYKKMESQNIPFDQISDLVAFRILVETVRDCYSALGVVHSRWKPIPGRFKDYIALAKPNLYQSLHTTVIGSSGQRMEIQIRTHEMHRVAEDGIAAHWQYKEGNRLSWSEGQRFTWLRQLMEWNQNTEDPHEFLYSFKEDLFADEVFAFTPKGDLLNFPRGASVIDFAYRIHSEVGNHCSGARVNGKLVSLRYQLRSGDTVEILPNAQQRPSKDWLKIVKTPRAQARIRAWIKTQQRERSVALGKEILERELQRHRVDLDGLRKQAGLSAIAKELGLKDEEALLANLGYGKISGGQILSKLFPQEEAEKKPKAKIGTLERIFRLAAKQSKSGIKVKGIDDVMARFPRCCSPLPGEDVIGFVTRGRGVTVHSIGCVKVLDSDPERRIEVTWDRGIESVRPVNIEVICVDQPGLLAAVTSAISASSANIAGAQCRTTEDQTAKNTFQVMISDSDQLKRVIRNVSRVKGVISVYRARG
jgi:GTP pyrophosphokinase